MLQSTLHLFAPAKINLFLHVTGKQDDGYHTLQSAMVFVNVGDELTLSPHDSLYLDVQGPFAALLENPKDNLVYKAAQLLAGYHKVPATGKITLTKNLPPASGIGGGSSDAAAILQGLVKLWNVHDNPALLAQLGRKLGADIPACLYKKPVWVEGTGEKLTPLPDMPPLHFVLVNPLVPTPTPEVFSHFRSSFTPPLQFSGRRKSAREWIADLKIYHNDLTQAALMVTPAIRDVLAALADTPNCLLHRLSGSGATCFGIYNTTEESVAAAHLLQTHHPDWWVLPAELLK